jgi:hypothetical protein
MVPAVCRVSSIGADCAKGDLMTRRIHVLVLLTVAALVASACSSAAETLTEQIVEAGAEGDVDVNIDDETVSVSFEDEDGSGSFTVGGGEIPSDFPVPVPDGGEVMSIFESEGDIGAAVSYDAGSYDELVAFYEDWVAGADLPELQTSTAEYEGARSVQWFSPSAGTYVSVTETPDGVLLSINVEG